jgi:hypothetical protein
MVAGAVGEFLRWMGTSRRAGLEPAILGLLMNKLEKRGVLGKWKSRFGIRRALF